MTTTFVAKILDLGVPTMSGKIYTAPVIQDAIDKVSQNPSMASCFVLLGLPVGPGVDLSQVCGLVDRFWIENASMKAEIKPLTSPVGTIFNTLRLSHPHVTGYGLNGYGTYEADGKTIKDFSLASISFIDAPPQKSFDEKVMDLLTK